MNNCLYTLLMAVLLNCPLASAECIARTLDFVMLEGNAMQASVEDDIERELAVLGITLNKRVLEKSLFNAAMRAGDFHLCFSETWGNPYDPASYATGWMANDEAHYSAMAGVTGANSRANIFAAINSALEEVQPSARANLWATVHQMVHETAVNLPLWGARIPAIMNQRIGGYQAGYQQFDYPLHRVIVQDSNKRVTVAPGAQTGLFQSVGRLDPHSYRPNEFFANNWVYEGLVSYGPDGTILPALAETWTETADTVTFRLRTGVTFHDGEAWNCNVAKLNFDHVFAEPLRSADWHGWYKLPTIFRDASCNSAGELVVRTTIPYTGILQELTFIRPLRMLSPASFNSTTSDSWMCCNSCPAGWGELSSGTTTITCLGISNPVGTGPFKFFSRTPDGDNDAEVVFHGNTAYWGGAPDIQELILKRFATSADVATALQQGTIDMVVGDSVLGSADLTTFANSDDFTTVLTPVLLHSLIIINSAKAPTDDINLRKAIIHGVDKASIIQAEFGSMYRAADRLFPRSAPYSDVELTPRWDYDSQKALLLNCPAPVAASEDDTDNGLVIGLLVVLGFFLFLAMLIAVYFFSKWKTSQSELKQALSKAVAPAPQPESVGQGETNL